MPYTADIQHPTPSPEELRARIPGWGVDLDPADRPAVPREQREETGAHWDIPDQQPQLQPRERSLEHARLTPVFGTAAPPRLLSGKLRRHSYRRYSEARAAHWLILLGADRVDALESHLQSFLTTRPDNPLTQSGVLSEFSRGGFRSRVGSRRADTNHQWLDPVIVAGPWVLAGAAGYAVVRRVSGRARRGHSS